MSHARGHPPCCVPCRSPRPSFLSAYVTEMARLHKYWPFIASMAASDASKLA